MATSTTVLFSNPSGTQSSLANANYKTFDTSVIQNTDIPKYSIISNAEMSVTIKTSLSSKAGLEFAFSNRPGGDGEPNGTVIKNFGDVIGSSAVTKTASILSYVNSGNANAGKYNGSYPYLLYWASASIIRRFTLYDVHIDYTFTKPTITYNLSTSGGGKVGFYNADTLLPDWSVTSKTFEVNTSDYTWVIEAEANTGYKFVKWSDGDTSKARNITISQDSLTATATTLSLTAIFEPIQYNVSVNVSPDDAGTVSGTQTGTYGYGTTITLQATPNDGYCFEKWLVHGGDVNIGNPQLSFTVNADTVVTAVFAAEKNPDISSVQILPNPCECGQGLVICVSFA